MAEDDKGRHLEMNAKEKAEMGADIDHLQEIATSLQGSNNEKEQFITELKSSYKLLQNENKRLE